MRGLAPTTGSQGPFGGNMASGLSILHRLGKDIRER